MASKTLVTKTFKLNGLLLSGDAISYLSQVLDRIPEESKRKRVVDKLVSTILRRSDLESNRISLNVCEAAVKECRTERSEDVKVFQVFGAFNTPRFTYNPETRKFIPIISDDSDDSGHMTTRLFPSQANAKAQLFRERYELVKQVTLHHSLFTHLSAASSGGSRSHTLGEAPTQHYRLQPVEFLLGTAGRLKDLIVLGMVTQVREGKWCLEDPTGIVPIDFAQTAFHQGLFPEGSFVLAEGWYEDKVFHVLALGLPPAELHKVSRERLGNSINMFSSSVSVDGQRVMAPSQNTRLGQLLSGEGGESMLVLMSQVDLTSDSVWPALETLFSGFADAPPVGFVMCGNFIGDQHSGIEQYKSLERGVRRLITLFASHASLLSTSHLVLVPGPQDPGLGRVLPRAPLPLSTDWVERIVGSEAAAKRIVLTTNPCRLQLYNQEIVVLREDVSGKVYRHCLHMPDTNGGELHTHLIRTLVSQAHLLPLPLHISPVYWPWDQALRLYPAPDLVLLADSAENPFIGEHAGCRFVNPGSFTSSSVASQSFLFKVYYPATGVVEASRVNTT